MSLSNPFGSLESSYGAVVIGSGYGGAVAAARLAAQGHSVCVLERGREWARGEFPASGTAVLEALRSAERPLGLFDYHLGDDVDVLCGSGLGGTSLINANVVLAPGAEVFEQPRWPRAVRDAARSGELVRYFARVREMLDVEPSSAAMVPARKVAILRRSASTQAPPVPHDGVDLAVNLSRHRSEPNHAGVMKELCTMCGDCVTGCNVGAKNTLDHSYLPLARRAGAQLHTCVEVRHLRRHPDGGWAVFAVEYDERGGAVSRLVHAGVVVLAAGVLGTTGILLRSQQRGLDLSRRIGHHFSSNADLLGFGYNTDHRTDVMGFGRDAAEFRVGPTIMSQADFRAGRPLGRQHVIQEGAIPGALVDLLRRVSPWVSFRQGRDTDDGIRDWARESARVLRDLLARDGDGALNASMVFLGIGHDGAGGRIVLDHRGRPRVLWGAAPELPILGEMDDNMYALTRALGGTYIKSPRWSEAYGHNAVTVHPLGGCAMADDPRDGAVDDRGRVYGGDGRALDGLYVCDGSVVPTSLGVNPLLTIAALAERIADGICARHAEAPLRPRAGVTLAVADPEPPVGIDFSEEMKGHVTSSVTSATIPSEYAAAEALGRDANQRLDVRLYIVIEDLARFIAEPAHEATAHGHVSSAVAGIGRGRRIEEGTFNLFFDDERLGTRRMLYRLVFTGEDDATYQLDGFKEVRDDPGFDLWSDNTTLFTTLRRNGTPFAQGILHVRIADLLRQLSTFRARNTAALAESLTALSRFGTFFFGSLWSTYLAGHVP